jgi:uncharacterized membrane protein
VYSNRVAFVLLLLVVISFAVSALLYDRLPDPMASHWAADGNVDGTVARAWGAFVVPVLAFVMWVLFTFLPRLVPPSLLPAPSGRIAGFFIVLFLFAVTLHLQLILWNLGWEVSFEYTIPIGLGVLFFYLGAVLGSVEPNWVVGIRTYWTLKNPVVWARTHQRAGVMFRILGLIYVAAAFFRGYLLLFILLPALFVALYLVGYSFVLYQKLEEIDDGRRS